MGARVVRVEIKRALEILPRPEVSGNRILSQGFEPAQQHEIGIGGNAGRGFLCQSAPKFDPLSASKTDPSGSTGSWPEAA